VTVASSRACRAGIAAANAAGQAAFRPVIEAAVTRLSVSGCNCLGTATWTSLWCVATRSLMRFLVALQATDAAPVAAAAPAGFTSAEAHTSALTAAERCIVAATRLSVDVSA